MTEDKIKKIIGRRLKLLRLDTGIRQVELAAKLKCSQKYLSAWETGRQWIPLKYFYQLATIFNISLDYFHPDIETPEESLKKFLSFPKIQARHRDNLAFWK